MNPKLAKTQFFGAHRSALQYSKLLTFIRCSLAFLLQSTPLTSFGTRNSVANFSVSVSAASNARKHFRTGSKNTPVYYFVDTAQRLPPELSIFQYNYIRSKLTSKSGSPGLC